MSASATSDGRRKRKKKPAEMLSSVIAETTPAAAVELLKGNTAFAMPSGTGWVTLFISAEALGGLSKAASGKDESKGSIAQLIDKDHIKVVATDQMLEEEVFGIIPTADVLDRMSEYGLLTRADYHWAVVSQPALDDLDVKVLAPADFVDFADPDEPSEAELAAGKELAKASFSKALSIAAGRASLQEVLGEVAWYKYSGDVEADEAAEDNEPPTEAVEQVQDAWGAVPQAEQEQEQDMGATETPAFSEEIPQDELVADPAGFEIDEGENVFFMEDELGNLQSDGKGISGFETMLSTGLGQEPVFVDDEADSFDPYNDDLGEDYGSVDPAVPQGTYVENVATAADLVARRFLSEKLDLDVRLDEFNTTFAVGAPVVATEIPEGVSEWLGDQYAQKTREVNAELARRRKENESKLRSLYVDLMGTHAELVLKSVSTESPDSPFGRTKAEITRIYNEQQALKDTQIREAKTGIIERYKSEGDQNAEAAATRARAQFVERNGARMEREQQNVSGDVEKMIEEAHSYAQSDLLERRREKAVVLMERGQTKVFQILRNVQEDLFESERELMTALREDLATYVDENRKNDVSRVEALHEHHSRVNEITELQTRHAETMTSQETSHRDILARLDEEIARKESKHQQDLAAREATWTHELELERQKRESEIGRNEDLSSQLTALGATYALQYESRIKELQADKDSFSDELENSNLVQSRSNKIMTILVAAMLVLGLGVGFILGVGFN